MSKFSALAGPVTLGAWTGGENPIWFDAPGDYPQAPPGVFRGNAPGPGWIVETTPEWARYFRTMRNTLQDSGEHAGEPVVDPFARFESGDWRRTTNQWTEAGAAWAAINPQTAESMAIDAHGQPLWQTRATIYTDDSAFWYAAMIAAAIVGSAVAGWSAGGGAAYTGDATAVGYDPGFAAGADATTTGATAYPVPSSQVTFTDIPAGGGAASSLPSIPSIPSIPSGGAAAAAGGAAAVSSPSPAPALAPAPMAAPSPVPAPAPAPSGGTVFDSVRGLVDATGRVIATVAAIRSLVTAAQQPPASGTLNRWGDTDGMLYTRQPDGSVARSMPPAGEVLPLRNGAGAMLNNGDGTYLLADPQGNVTTHRYASAGVSGIIDSLLGGLKNLSAPQWIGIAAIAVTLMRRR